MIAQEHLEGRVVQRDEQIDGMVPAYLCFR